MIKNNVHEIFKKEVMEKDALNRIKWDSELNKNDFSVCYLDRISKRLIEAKYNDLLIDGDFLIIEDKFIPLHRIREIRYKGRVVWAKRRVD